MDVLWRAPRRLRYPVQEHRLGANSHSRFSASSSRPPIAREHPLTYPPGLESSGSTTQNAEQRRWRQVQVGYAAQPPSDKSPPWQQSSLPQTDLRNGKDPVESRGTRESRTTV